MQSLQCDFPSLFRSVAVSSEHVRRPKARFTAHVGKMETSTFLPFARFIGIIWPAFYTGTAGHRLSETVR